MSSGRIWKAAALILELMLWQVKKVFYFLQIIYKLCHRFRYMWLQAQLFAVQ